MSKLKPEHSRKGFLDKATGKLIRFFRDRKRLAVRREFRARMRPMPCSATPVADLHYLLCARDFEMGLIAAFSLLHFSRQPLRLRFFEDGSLQESHWKELNSMFPGHSFFPRTEVDARIESDFGADSPIARVRKINPLFHKLFDIPYLAEGNRVTYSDPDILYFSDPAELVALAAGDSKACVFNRDMDNSYIYPLPELNRILGRSVPERVNAGLYSIARNAIDFGAINDWLMREPFSGFWKSWRVEQTLFAFLPGETGSAVELLPPPYDVDFFKKPELSPCKHYVGWIRHGFELEGLRFLLDSGRV